MECVKRQKPLRMQDHIVKCIALLCFRHFVNISLCARDGGGYSQHAISFQAAMLLRFNVLVIAFNRTMILLLFSQRCAFFVTSFRLSQTNCVDVFLLNHFEYLSFNQYVAFESLFFLQNEFIFLFNYICHSFTNT